MTQPSGDNAIWMLTDKSSKLSEGDTYHGIVSTTNVIRSSFITNLRSEHTTDSNVKCWCSKCAKERLKNNMKKDLLFISSDLLYDFLRQYQILEWSSERWNENLSLPTFHTMHPGISEVLKSEVLKVAEEFHTKPPKVAKTISRSISDNSEKAVPTSLSPPYTNSQAIKTSSSLPKSMAGHTILKNLESPLARRHSLSDSASEIEFRSRPMNITNNRKCERSVSLINDSSTDIKSKTTNTPRKIEKPKIYLSNSLKSDKLPDDTDRKTYSLPNVPSKNKYKVVSSGKTIRLTKIPSGSKKLRYKFKKRLTKSCLTNKDKSSKMAKFPYGNSSTNNGRQGTVMPGPSNDTESSIPPKSFSTIGMEYQKTLNNLKKKIGNDHTKYFASRSFPMASSLKGANDQIAIQTKDEGSTAKKVIFVGNENSTDDTGDPKQEDEYIVSNCHVTYPIHVTTKRFIPHKLLQAQNRIVRSVSETFKPGECFGSFCRLTSEQKNEIFEKNGVDLARHLTVVIEKSVQETAISKLLEQNKRNGIITPAEICSGASIDMPHLVSHERRHSSDSDSGVDVSIGKLITGSKPPPPVPEPITCNLCTDKKVYQSTGHLWSHQSSKHLGRDCTKENVFPIQENQQKGCFSYEINQGPNMCQFEENESLKEKHRQLKKPAWVCFECEPPKILTEQMFNSHAEELLHCEGVVHYKDLEEAKAEVLKITKKS